MQTPHVANGLEANDVHEHGGHSMPVRPPGPPAAPHSDSVPQLDPPLRPPGPPRQAHSQGDVGRPPMQPHSWEGPAGHAANTPDAPRAPSYALQKDATATHFPTMQPSGPPTMAPGAGAPVNVEAGAPHNEGVGGVERSQAPTQPAMMSTVSPQPMALHLSSRSGLMDI